MSFFDLAKRAMASQPEIDLDADAVTVAFSDVGAATQSARMSVKDLEEAIKKLELQPYQQSIFFTTAGAQRVSDEIFKMSSRTLTMELEMRGDLFDPFKVEAGCAHPEDRRGPLPYRGAPPGDDEWMCDVCGYWRKGDAFGVSPLPSDPEPGPSPAIWGVDLASGPDVAVPVPFPRLPMPNSKVSYDSVVALMKEVRSRSPRGPVTFGYDTQLDSSAAMIVTIRLFAEFDERTPDKEVMDALYALDHAGRYVRARDQFFEAHPSVLYDLRKRFVGQAIAYPMSPQVPYQLFGRNLIDAIDLPKGMISLTHTSERRR